MPLNMGTGLNYTPINQYMSPPQTQAPMQTIILVNNETEASSWNVAPGNSVFFMNSNDKLFYIKSVDFSGMSTFRRFRFEEITEQQETPPEYITREEFEEWKRTMRPKQYYKPHVHQKKGDKIDG